VVDRRIKLRSIGKVRLLSVSDGEKRMQKGDRSREWAGEALGRFDERGSGDAGLVKKGRTLRAKRHKDKKKQ
jgi:hypothetical protein